MQRTLFSYYSVKQSNDVNDTCDDNNDENSEQEEVQAEESSEVPERHKEFRQIKDNVEAFSFDACNRTRTHANLSARAICRTHEKSYSAEKVLFIEYSSFNPSFMFTSTIFE